MHGIAYLFRIFCARNFARIFGFAGWFIDWFVGFRLFMRGRAGCAAVARRGSERARRMVAATTYRLRGSNSYFIARIKFIASGLSRAHFVLCGLYIRIRNRCRGLFRNRIRIRDQDICTDSNVMYASVGVQFSCVDTIIHTCICGQRQTHIRVCQTTTHVCTQTRCTHA